MSSGTHAALLPWDGFSDENCYYYCYRGIRDGSKTKIHRWIHRPTIMSADGYTDLWLLQVTVMYGPTVAPTDVYVNRLFRQLTVIMSTEGC